MKENSDDPTRTSGDGPDDHDATAPLGDSTAADATPKSSDDLPESIGRYRVARVLGKGAFGRVLLARDQQLDRNVAIKVPHSELVSVPEHVEAYLAEAKTVASLDHPHIVPVHDAGSSDGFPFFVVSKYIKGQDLKARLKDSRPTIAEAVQLVATLAEALHHAHTRGFVHRDVKPGNILLDDTGKPYLVDFGLALKERDLGKGPQYAGTPAYMSPEQARGEGHRVDGRSDIFSLGVVLYELIAGRRPFQAETTSELLSQISSTEAKPPRQVNDAIPKELERICLKSLARRASDRYTTALDLADDLGHFLSEAKAASNRTHATVGPSQPVQGDSTKKPNEITATASDGRQDSDSGPIRIVPKGLRSFDRHDADFFLELLPGPRDRLGLPDTIRFWKTRIEERDPDETFAVGLIYGPSGCGKSSLMKAGLLPRLSECVVPVYIEATAAETESRLLHGIRKACPGLDTNLDLSQSLAAVRRGRARLDGKKLLLVMDQFEQWLHAKRDEEETELVRALRQCDGAHLQCIVMVRDDFWLAASRFAREIEVRFLDGTNTALVDLFPIRHAKKVLRAFGAAFGALPEDTHQANPEQETFVERATDGLAEDGKVISVRLALFAEMMKGKSWTPETLKQVGGTKGVGVTFLDETFSASTASPEHRLHQKAARRVLKALLPDSGTDIKGQMKSEEDLRQASGYASRPKDFDELLQVLDGDLRLITPTDPEGMESDDDEAVDVLPAPHARYYQLTHDYLVHSLRDWLTRKQKETRQGRAELALADRAAVWNARPENRQLPSPLQWWRIRWYTDAKHWTQPQRKMMARAGRVFGTQATIAASLILIAGIAIWQLLAWQQREREQLERQTAQRITVTAVDSLQAAQSIAVPFFLEKLDTLPRELVLEELNRRFPDATGQAKLSLAYGLAHYQQPDVDTIISGAIDPETSPNEVMNIVTGLRLSSEEAIPKLQTAAKAASEESDWSTKTRLATLALYLGDTTIAADMLRDGPTETGPDVTFDPVQRTRFIALFPSWSGEVAELAAGLADVGQPHLRSGFALALGGIDRPREEAKSTWEPVLVDWHANSPDGGTHSASDWALRQWELDVPELAPEPEPRPGRDWWRTSNLTLIRIPSGSVVGESGPIFVESDFWLCDREVNVGMFQQFMDDEAYQGLKPSGWEGAKVFDNETSPDLPVQHESWFEAVMFCNWLSWKLGREPAYEIVIKIDSVDPRIMYVVKRLSTGGIRLPTKAEWEYACRANTTTDFAFGDGLADLSGYGWCFRNSESRTHSIGAKRCNAWGLFDMHGNVWEWCWDLSQDYDDVNRIDGRVYRGGGWNNIADLCQSSIEDVYIPAISSSDLGFRVALGPLRGAEPRVEVGEVGVQSRQPSVP